MTDQNQNNISKLSVNLKNTISNHSIPHVSRVTKIERRHPSSKNNFNTNRLLLKQILLYTQLSECQNTIYIISLRISMLKKIIQFRWNYFFYFLINSFHLFSRLITSKLWQDIYLYFHRILGIFKKYLHLIQRHKWEYFWDVNYCLCEKEIFQSHLNRWNDPYSNKNIQKKSSFLPTQQYSNSRMHPFLPN